MAVAGNILKDAWRSQITEKRRAPPTISLDETGADNDGKPKLDIVDPQPDPYTVTEVQERRLVLRRAIATLPLQMRRCVTLFYLDGLSRSEVAAVLELTEGAVNAHINRAKQKISKYMEKFYGIKSSER